MRILQITLGFVPSLSWGAAPQRAQSMHSKLEYPVPLELGSSL